MRIPIGDEDRRMQSSWFSNTNRIRFDFSPTKEIEDWWKEHMFDPHGLTPEALAERFTASWADHRQIEFKTIDPDRPEISFSVHDSSGDATVWLVDRCIDLDGKFVEALRMAVADDWQFEGIGRRLMKNAVDTGLFLGCDRIRLDADDVGRYSWVRMGFVPDRGSWRSIREACIRSLMQFSQTLGPARTQEIVMMLMSNDPKTMRLIADLKDPVEEPRLRRRGGLEPQVVPLGKAMLLGDCPIWAGEFDLRDATSLSLMEDCVDATR
ncbi:GNAT family N-acetyltransferase [Aureimonas phyllosphaerae]|uniref:GNAT family N-acetyltransferase n=1 Tax=Aureimonas phyllosphaerae TaxID=1166078 RepID=UPI003A5B9F20